MHVSCLLYGVYYGMLAVGWFNASILKMAAEMLVLENFINGKFLPCRNHIDSYDPSTGKVYCKVPDSGQEEVDAAVSAAIEAFER